MTYDQATFTQLLTQYLGDMGRVLTAGAVNEASASDRATGAARLTQACEWLWSYQQTWSLPQTLETGTLTLATGGKVEAADIDYAEHWSFWSQDPRAIDPRTDNLERYHLRGIRQNGDVLILDGTAGTSIVGFWRTRPPQFTSEVVEVGRSDYAAGDLVWDRDSTKHCYLAIDANADGANLSDGTKWARQSVAMSLKRALCLWANYERLALETNLPANAQMIKARALEEADCLCVMDVPSMPWLRNDNGTVRNAIY